MQAAGFYHEAADGTLQCDLCRHYCRIRAGRTGMCRVRRNVDGRLYSLSFGHAIAQAGDPVEKKPLYHFMPGTKTWSFGTPGCNFTCGNCQNWQISQCIPDEARLPVTSPEKIVENALQAGCASIACTYTEPTIFAEYALETMKLAKAAGLRTIWVSNGYMSPNCLDAVSPWLDATNIDLKSMDDAFYRRTCGARVEPVLDNLRHIFRGGIHLEITTLVIPGYSDAPEMLERLAGFIAKDLGPEVPWHVIPFYPEISWKMSATPAAGVSALEMARAIGKSAGLSYIYSGAGSNDTFCTHCGHKLVQRHRTLGNAAAIRFDSGGRCPSCNAHSPIKD
ncbi:MAG: AmmeMemoRadiSam system radical SAM enzyme [Chlorobiaceae bacterium]|nr:AmmeMemoRadiSam system radical SAM enzyme [Chlorobiaceae bacterium]